MVNRELSPEQEQFVREANEKSRLAREEREAKRLQRAEKLEGRKAEYAAIRGELREIHQRMADMNGKYNAERVELGDVSNAKLAAAGAILKETVGAAPAGIPGHPQGGVEEVSTAFSKP